MPNKISGTLAALNATSPTFIPRIGGASPPQFNVSISGTFVGTWELQRSFDGEVSWHKFDSHGIPAEKTFDQTEVDVKVRLKMVLFTSGTLVFQLSS